MGSSPFHPLDRSLHDFDPQHFGSTDDLRSVSPTSEGWSAIMVTCSEFGFQPDQNSIFEIGELYVIQNFGNVVLPLEDSGTEVTWALETKGLQDVIVCGHLNCRTIGHFLFEERKNENDWLNHGNQLKYFVESNYKHLDENQKTRVAAQENVLLQIEKVIASLNAEGPRARFYGWITEGLTNQIFHYDPVVRQFTT